MGDPIALLRAHRRAAKKANVAARALGEAVVHEAAKAIGGVWRPNGEHGAFVEIDSAWLWLSLDSDEVWRVGFGREWSTETGEGADPRAAAYAWLRANARCRRPEIIAAREWLATLGLHV